MRSSVTVALSFYKLQYGSMLLDYFKIMGITSDNKLLHSLLCCKTRMQAYCGHMDRIGDTVKSCFAFCRLLESCVVHSYFHHCLFF